MRARPQTRLRPRDARARRPRDGRGAAPRGARRAGRGEPPQRRTQCRPPARRRRLDRSRLASPRSARDPRSHERLHDVRDRWHGLHRRRAADSRLRAHRLPGGRPADPVPFGPRPHLHSARNERALPGARLPRPNPDVGRRGARFNPRLGADRTVESFIELMDRLTLSYPKKMDEAVRRTSTRASPRRAPQAAGAGSRRGRCTGSDDRTPARTWARDLSQAPFT